MKKGKKCGAKTCSRHPSANKKATKKKATKKKAPKRATKRASNKTSLDKYLKINMITKPLFRKIIKTLLDLDESKKYYTDLIPQNVLITKGGRVELRKGVPITKLPIYHGTNLLSIDRLFFDKKYGLMFQGRKVESNSMPAVFTVEAIVNRLWSLPANASYRISYLARIMNEEIRNRVFSIDELF